MALLEVPGRLSVLAPRVGGQDLRYVLVALAFACAQGARLALAMGMMVGLFLGRVGFGSAGRSRWWP